MHTGLVALWFLLAFNVNFVICTKLFFAQFHTSFSLSVNVRSGGCVYLFIPPRAISFISLFIIFVGYIIFTAKIYLLLDLSLSLQKHKLAEEFSRMNNSRTLATIAHGFNIFGIQCCLFEWFDLDKWRLQTSTILHSHLYTYTRICTNEIHHIQWTTIHTHTFHDQFDWWNPTKNVEKHHFVFLSSIRKW